MGHEGTVPNMYEREFLTQSSTDCILQNWIVSFEKFSMSIFKYLFIIFKSLFDGVRTGY